MDKVIRTLILFTPLTNCSESKSLSKLEIIYKKM